MQFEWLSGGFDEGSRGNARDSGAGGETAWDRCATAAHRVRRGGVAEPGPRRGGAADSSLPRGFRAGASAPWKGRSLDGCGPGLGTRSGVVSRQRDGAVGTTRFSWADRGSSPSRWTSPKEAGHSLAPNSLVAQRACHRGKGDPGNYDRAGAAGYGRTPGRKATRASAGQCRSKRSSSLAGTAAFGSTWSRKEGDRTAAPGRNAGRPTSHRR
jgi:hypothetical protein